MTLDFLNQFDFFAGVPDSQLKPLCDYLYDSYSISNKHIIAANEGGAVALAAGYHLATGKTPVVYLQNSGIGNIVNPVASLLNDEVYSIPCLFIIGFRGEPGVADEPQHIFQGKITLKLLEDMDISYFVADKNTTDEQINQKMREFGELLKKGKQVAFVIKKGALQFEKKISYKNEHTLKREEIIKKITDISEDDIIVSTTGKASRELFEIREQKHQSHKLDFLTVGSMGHSSSIALGIALKKPEQKIWIIDGDGSFLMHMGSMAVIGSNAPKNIIHIVINNSAHETVGGMPTVSNDIDLIKIAEGCGYKYAAVADSEDSLELELNTAKEKNELCFIEVKCAIGARENLGRPTTTPKQNKQAFMENLL